ncbi:MAG: bifunctional glycosyltransferase family 2/GtrA family protein [Lachnospiraceae bacterium]|nr:bifunctional glycosyltransferase family 2/GtrA family protein [Lachnospiraceae bacterium]
METKELSEIIALVPAYCPEQSMVESVTALTEIFPAVIIVDDGCGAEYKGIFDAVEGLKGVTILRHPENRGKGCALKTGFNHILEKYPEAKGVVTLDADGQHTVKDTVACCEKFLENPHSIVFGCRDFESDTKIPPRSRFGNRLTSRLMKFFCDIKLSDTQTGLRVHSMDYLKELAKVAGDRYEYEMNVIFALKELGVPFVEVPIEVIYLDNNASSHFNPIKDSMKIYKVFIKFCISSFGSFLIDIILFTIMCGLLKQIPEGNLLRTYYIPVSTGAARVCSGVFNYSFNRWIFGSRSKVSSSGPKYLVVWLIQLCISAFCVDRLVSWLKGNETITKFFVDTILFFISYKVQQLWVFKPTDKEV